MGVIIEVWWDISVEVNEFNLTDFSILILIKLINQLTKHLLLAKTTILVKSNAVYIKGICKVVSCNASLWCDSLPSFVDDLGPVAAQFSSDSSNELLCINETVTINIEVPVHLLEFWWSEVLAALFQHPLHLMTVKSLVAVLIKLFESCN